MSNNNRRESFNIKYSLPIKILLILGLWISNTKIGCTALPHPQRLDNSIYSSFQAPLISPLKEELTLMVNTTYTLRCECNESIVWYKEYVADSTKFIPEDPTLIYGSELILANIDSNTVGAYYCIKASKYQTNEQLTTENINELVNSNDASTIYIYVDGTIDKLAPIVDHLISAPQYSDVVVPCKPNIPETEVILTAPNGEVIISSLDLQVVNTTLISHNHITFDPKKGFTLGNLRTEQNTNLFCVTRDDLKDTRMPFSILIFQLNVENNSKDTTQYSSEIIPTGIIAEKVSTALRRKRRETVDTTTPITLDYERYNYRSSTRNPRRKKTHIDRPNITTKSQGHVYVGDDFELKCELCTERGTHYSMNWSTPIPSYDDRILITPASFLTEGMNTTHIIGRTIFKVFGAKRSDAGKYECHVSDYFANSAKKTQMIIVLEPNTTYIEMQEPNNVYDIGNKAHDTVHMVIHYKGFPAPSVSWFKPDGSEIRQSHQYTTEDTGTRSTLIIKNAQMTDSGNYTVRATNDVNDIKELQFVLKISDKPIVSVEHVYVEEGTEAHLECRVLSMPTAYVAWNFTPCGIKPRWPACSNHHQQAFNSSRNGRPGSSIIEIIHELKFMPTEPGIMSCMAQNKIGFTSAKAHVMIGDIAENMTIYGIDENVKIARDDNVKMTCAALAYYYENDLHWYSSSTGERVVPTDNIRINNEHSTYVYKTTLEFKAVRDEDSGSYECRASHIYNSSEFDIRDISLFVHEPKVPEIITRLDSKIKRKLGETLELECRSNAIPRAEVRWYKDGQLVQESNHTKIYNNDEKLLIRHLFPGDDGVYNCIVENRLGKIEESVTVVISNLPGLKLGWVIALSVLFILLVALCIYLYIRFYKERASKRELKAAGLANFEEGSPEQINEALTLDEQADLLPYDRRFEFPRNKLKLDKQLGAGAFGVVLKAYAQGLRAEEPETIVAVKMVKRTADNEVVKALVSELKIMIHLGQHLNVVNLLGAVTKNISKRELMVMVEYCRFGNVQNFLLRNRKSFINQICPHTGKLDPTIMTQRFSDNFDMHGDVGLRYANLNFPQYINEMNNMNNNYKQHQNRRDSDNDPRPGTRAGRPSSTGYVSKWDVVCDTGATEQTVMTTVPEDDDHVLSNNSIQPAWRSNYKPDTTESMSVTTSNLISWAFQVSRGMDYLSRRKVLHGDLAARNILLCEDNVVKICDFGLARSMYRGENYKKTGDARLPIKWLALESLSDHVFSTYTDVWSFGIVLWELFSLAKVPYPGINPNQDFFLKLENGYRMEKPPYANDDLYDIMLECWSKNPESRPLFYVLEKRFERMLGEEVTNHYVDLNDPYLRMNDENMRDQKIDYLGMMGPPDELAPEPPRYVNGHILPEIRIDTSPDDYLQMSADTGTAIFSPTRPKDIDLNDDNDVEKATTTTSSFNFPDARKNGSQHSPTLANNIDSPVRKQLRHKDDFRPNDPAPEEIPMLHNVHHSGSSDAEEPSPEQARKYSNILKQLNATPTPSPRHHMETNLNGEESYVNIKPPRKHLNNNNNSSSNGNGSSVDAFSNPSYQPVKTVHGRRD